ncbi:MAG TPA: urea ABC transporter substrate-binding protein [Candidatus Limnocylindria bacterium]|nr:urea ABC transporter substrate-binding protein [Candidatus Limnocylindria bacterium]
MTPPPVSRRQAILAVSGAAAGAALSSIGIIPKPSAAAAATIKLGWLGDRSGDFALIGIQKYHAAQLAVKEINDKGGLLGRQVELIAPDTQSDNRRYQEMARQLILQDQVDVIHGGMTSASREAIRPIMDQNKMLYFYNNQYEGGVCDTYTFCTGCVPEHQVFTLIPGLIKKFGPKLYTIAADYNFGQITAKWVRQVATQNGGQIIGEEFIPLDVGQFSSTIERIEKAKPDLLVTLLVGITQSAFYEQRVSAGLKLPMATTVNMAQGYEHKRFKPPALENMYVTTNYMEELTNPSARAFAKRFRAMFPNDAYIGEEAAAEYEGIHLWAEGVRRAKTADKDAVRKALETGVSFNGPSGPVILDPKTHHTTRNLFLVHADAHHNIHVDKEFYHVAPDWLSKDKGCDLPVKPDQTQYQPA